MAEVLNSAREIVNGVSDISNDVRRVSSAMGKTSVTRLTKDQVFQFPVFMNSSIDDDEKYPIIKSIETNYAQLVMIAITNTGVIDRDRYDDINQFLRKFHNNNGIPTVPGIESVSVSNVDISDGFLPANEAATMLDTFESQLDLEPINNLYKPFNRTVAKLSMAIEAASSSQGNNAQKKHDDEVRAEERKRIEAEADAARPRYAKAYDEFFRAPVYKKNKLGKELTDSNGQRILETTKDGKPAYHYIKAPDKRSSKYADLQARYGDSNTMSGWREVDLTTRIDEKAREDEYSRRKAEENEAYRRSEDRRKELKADEKEARKERLTAISAVKPGNTTVDSKYNAMAPTVINMTLANMKKQVGAWSQNVTIGVKAAPRMMPSSLLVSSLVDACKNRPIFKFIQWTKHELKFLDLFFGVSTIRNDFKDNNRWLGVLRHRAIMSKLPFAKLNPNTTVIITDNDVHQIYEQCGVNLDDPANVRKLMDKYFFLGFGIYDTEGKMLRIIYDGESDWTHQSLRSIIANTKKDADKLLAMSRY